MNWTGGRLRLQSRARPNSLVRLQRGHFAKARLKRRQAAARLAGSGLVSPPKEQLNQLYSTQEPKSGFVEKASVTIDNSVSSHGSTQPGSRPPIVRHRVNRRRSRQEDLHFSPKNTSQLEDIKRSLLQKGDWVGLSISRPLHMRFPRFDEKNMIGRRRKVSHGTKTRNTVLDRQSAVSPSKCSNTTQSHGSQWASEGPLHTRHKSPGSMLLDVDGAESGQLLESSSWNVDSGDLWLFHDDFADRTEHDGLVLHEFSLTEDCGSSVTVHEYEDRNATVLSPDNQLQARNRFTLDDQILEEQMKANRKRSAFMDTHNSEFGDLAICNPCSRKTDDNRSDVSPVFESTDMLGRRSVSSVLQWNNPDSPGQAAKMSKQWGPASQETNARSPLVIFGKRISPQSTARPLQTWCPSSFHIQDHYYQRRNGESRKSSDAYFGEPSENSRQELEQSPTSESYPFAIKIHRNTTTMSYTQRTPMTPSAYNNALVATPSSFRTSETSPFRFRSLHAEH